MTKVALWTNQDKDFHLTSQHIAWLNERHATVPQRCGDYDNFDEILIESIEAMQKATLQNLKEEYSLYTQLQEKRAHFAHVFDSFEVYVIRLWVQILMKNMHIIRNPKSESIFNSVMYHYSWETFQHVCEEMNIQFDDDFEEKFSALLSRREAMFSVMKQRNDAHESYIKFCDYVGMKTFSHIPAISGFEIMEYDESKYQARVIKHSSGNQKWEELKLYPIS